MTTRFAAIFGALLVAALGWPASGAADGIMLITAGAFWMGRDDGPAEEAPQHRVYVTDFWIEREKVTNAEFAEFLNATGATVVSAPRIPTAAGGFVVERGFERAPVLVPWVAARDFCRWRGRRLATEAEWEKAARGVHGVEDLLTEPREWTATIFTPYPYRYDDGREPFAGRGLVVVRGGSATARQGDDGRAAAGARAAGFRCATSEDLGGR